MRISFVVAAHERYAWGVFRRPPPPSGTLVLDRQRVERLLTNEFTERYVIILALGSCQQFLQFFTPVLPAGSVTALQFA
jgi:hypothetical protein